ncbi:MAG: helicase HerA-like domain-containing protein [Saprospiraceae bacterium]
MSNKDQFIQEITSGYTFKGDSIVLGGAIYDKSPIPNCLVKIPLKMMNRHGLIAGATGSGKTKTLQIIAEQLSAKSVPVLMMDIKGDLSGVAVPSAGHPKIEERHANIGIPFTASGSPVEFLTLSDEPGARLRATVTEFGPILLSKILDLSETQSGVLAVVFKYCDDNKWALIDLKDLKKVLQFITGEGKDDFKKEYGTVSTTSVGAIMRKIVELEQQGAEVFFGERSFEVDDLCRLDENGKGIISIVRLTDIQDKPKLFSTFMLQMLAEIYASFPEEGDMDAPKLVIFIDEAHLVFENASSALMDQIEAIVKLIRSKGIGIFFVTQNPTDVPDAVLGQLGLKIQHALRAFTAKDRKAIKLTAQNYPMTEHYQVETLLTELGIGEAFITTLNEKGIPTPLVHALLRAPQSRMDILTDKEIENIIDRSVLVKKYNEVIDRDSAYEILNKKIERFQEEEHQAELKGQREKGRASTRQEKSAIEKVLTSTTTRQIGRTVARELTRGLLGALGIKTSTRRSSSKKSSWF